MRKIKAILMSLCLAMSLLAGSAVAGDWNYVEGAYIATDAKSLKGDAWAVNASKTLGDHLFVQGGFRNGMDADLSASTASVGLGLKTSLDADTDLYAKVTADVAVENVQTLDKYGYTAEAGARLQLTDKLELRGGVIAANLRDAQLDSVQWLGTAGAEWALTDSVRLGLDVRGKEDVLEGQVGIRLYF